MKIICTKEEQARLVRQCYRQMCCRGCALYGVCDGENSIAAFVEDAPAVDGVEVVRCGECRRGYLGIVSPDDFCSRGERRDNG